MAEPEDAHRHDEELRLACFDRAFEVVKTGSPTVMTFDGVIKAIIDNASEIYAFLQGMPDAAAARATITRVAGDK